MTNNTLTFEVQTVDPDTARNWLDTANTANRPVNKAAVERYAAEMAAGRWQVNGTTIVFDTNGTLVDGQHRLLAICEAQVPVEAIVVRGVPAGSFATIDVGKLRTVSDSLKAAHAIPSDTKGAGALVSLLGQATRIVVSYEQYKTLVHKGKISNAEILDYLAVNGDALKLAVQEVTHEMPKTLPQATFAALLYLTRDENYGTEMFQRFITDVVKPEHLKVSNPAKELRHHLDHLPQGTRKDGIPFRVCVAWNAYALGDYVDFSKPVSTFVRPETCKEVGGPMDAWKWAEPTVTTSEPEATAEPEPEATKKPEAGAKQGRRTSPKKTRADTAVTEVPEVPFDMSAPLPVTAADWNGIV